MYAGLLISLICLCESASIYPKNDTLEVIKKDISNVGSAIQDFTFDVLRNVLDQTVGEDEEAATTVSPSPRKVRSVDDLEPCQQRCKQECSQNHQSRETEHIQDLKSEVKKLQELVKLLKDQQKIMTILDDKEKEAPKETRAEKEEPKPNNEQLEMIKSDLKDVIKNLNETKELMGLQKEKSELLEGELEKQQEEIKRLRAFVYTLIDHNSTISERSTEDNPQARTSELSELKKLLNDDEPDDSDEIRAKVLQLEKQLKKKKRQQSLAKELKALTDEDEPDDDLLKRLIKALRKTEPKPKSDDLEVNNLQDLEEAINKLKPKEDNDAAQFQAMLNKLINRPTTNSNKSPQITITPQQMGELTKKLTPTNHPYICIVDDGSAKTGGYRVPVNPRNFQFYPPDYNNQQFFPGFAQPTYYPQASASTANPDKPLNYQPEAPETYQKYQEDLKRQIDGLQTAIDSLNRPEYVQRPEDKATIDGLEQQVDDLRHAVGNLNYEPRTKRSADDNKIEDGGELDKMAALVSKYLDEDVAKKSSRFEDIQNKIDTIKNELGNGARAAGQYQQPQLYFDESATEMKTSFKNDIFAEIVSKILDKLISAIPVIVRKLFNFSVDGLSKYDSQDYDVQTLFKNLGIFAYLPVILLRLLRGVGSFLNILRKNSFFRNFLLPAVILATVAGSVLFLIWWLQPDQSEAQYQSIAYDQNYPVTNNYPVYSRSYLNK